MTPPPEQRRRPNVIVFFTDQQRWDSTGVHGNPLGLTPNYDAMARRGTHAENAFTCQPVCGPARSCMQTGLYASKSGCATNSIALPAGSRTIAHHFRDAGYHTGYIGKWHLAGKENPAGPVPEHLRGGYEYWLASEALEHTSDAYRCVVYDNDNQPVRLPGYRVDALTDASIRYIDDHKNEPFFLFLSLLEPHHQNHRDDYPAPRGYAEQYTGRWTPPDLATLPGNAHQHLGGYWGMVKRIDEALGRMLDALQSLGLLDDTIVLFTTDHGCHFKTRNSEYKRSCHESSVRLPMAFRGPGFDGGGTLNQLISLIDVPPTLLDAAGIRVPAEMQGRSILPLIHAKNAPWPDEVFIQISESGIGRSVRTHRWKYGVWTPGPSPLGPRYSERYVEHQLYDLQADPYELTNLVGFESHRAVANVLRDRLLRRMKDAGEPDCIIEPAPPIKSHARKVLPEELNA